MLHSVRSAPRLNSRLSQSAPRLFLVTASSTSPGPSTRLISRREASTDGNNNSGPTRWEGGKMADMGPTVTAPRTVIQDMPPEGGFRPVRMRRNSPKKLWNVTTLLVVGASIMVYGWYQYFFTYVRHQQLENEKYVLMDLALTPVLQAEKDIMAFRKKVAELKELDKELKNDDSFQADWDGQFFKLAKKYTFPFNESQKFITKENLSVTFKGTGLMQREKEYLQRLKEM